MHVLCVNGLCVSSRWLLLIICQGDGVVMSDVVCGY